MKRSFFCKETFAVLLFSAIISSAFAENFRVRKIIPVQISQNGESRKIISGISDAVLINLPADMTFINGVELTFKIPEEIAVWRDSVAYTFYDNISPAPSENQLDYYGEKIFLKTVPPKLSLVLDIPLSADFSIKDSPYSVRVPAITDYEKGIFLRFQQVMKGVPDSLESAEIEITAKPILRDEGILSLSVYPDQSESKKYTVYIDENPAGNYKNLMLKTGEHHLSISGESYRNELRTFRIEQGKTTAIEVTLRGNEPLFKIVSPEPADVTLDDKPLQTKKNSFTVTPGEHIIKFKLGNYEIVKNVTAANGHSYIISLDVSASVTEEE